MPDRIHVADSVVARIFMRRLERIPTLKNDAIAASNRPWLRAIEAEEQVLQEILDELAIRVHDHSRSSL